MSESEPGKKSDRKVVNFRLTGECRRLLEELALRRGIAKSAVIELLVREEARRDYWEIELKSAA